MTSSTTTPLAAFRHAKGAFEQKAHNVKATDGIIDNGMMLEKELTALLEMARDAWIPLAAADLKFLGPLAETFAEVSEGRIPEARWQELSLLLPVDPSPLSTGLESQQPNAGHDAAQQPMETGNVEMETGLRRPLPSLPSEAVSPHSTSLERPPTQPVSIAPADVPPQVVSPPHLAQSFGHTPHETTPPLPSATAPSIPNATTPPLPTATEHSLRTALAVDNIPEPKVDTQHVADTQKLQVVEQRPTTGGKSLEYLAKLGLAHRSCLKVSLKRSREPSANQKKYVDIDESDGEDGLEDDGIDGDDDDDEYVIDPEDQPKKKRRVISAPFIEDSDEDVPKRRRNPKAKPRTLDDWPHFPSPDPCSACITAQIKCFTFVLHPKGWRNQKQRRSCTNCYLKKKACLFNRIYKEQQADNPEPNPKKRNNPKKPIETDEADQPISSKGNAAGDEGGTNGVKPKKNKGKGKAKGDDHQMEGDGDQHERTAHRPAPQRPSRRRQVRYRSVLPGEAGPSNNRRIENEEHPLEVAELFAKMNEFKDGLQGFQTATMEHFSVIDQNMDRLDSNMDTQKKFFTSELKNTRLTAEAAFDQSSENRQSINTILEYSGKTAEFMSSLMDRLANLRFDLPNALDHWASVKFGDQAGPSTVTASQLHHDGFHSSASSIPIPRMQLPIINLPRNDQQQPPVNPRIDPPLPPSPLSQSIPPTVWKEFMLSSSSGEEAESIPPRKGQTGAASMVKVETESDRLPHWSTLGQGAEGDIEGDVTRQAPPLPVDEEMKEEIGEDTPFQTNGGGNVETGQESRLTNDDIDNGDAIPANDAIDIGNPVPANDTIDNSDPIPANNAVDTNDPIEMLDNAPIADPIEDSPPMQSQNFDLTEDPIETDATTSVDDAIVMTQIEEPKVDDDHHMSDDTEVDRNDIVDTIADNIRNLDTQMRVIRMPIVSQDSVDNQQGDPLPVVQDETMPTGHPLRAMATVNVIPPTPVGSQGTLMSSPSVITHMTVHPPPGLLADEVARRSPMASDNGITSHTLMPGPVTRARSASRSTGSETRPPAPSKKPKSKGRKAK